jgi:lipopolysaccharide export LptBFGC system permease protein LptF
MEASASLTRPLISQNLAKASWICPLGIFGLMAVSSGVRNGRIIIEVIGLVLALVGLSLGIAALFGIKRYGRKKILAPALTGIVINSLIVLIWVTNFWAAYERTRSARHPAA